MDGVLVLVKYLKQQLTEEDYNDLLQVIPEVGENLERFSYGCEAEVYDLGEDVLRVNWKKSHYFTKDFTNLPDCFNPIKRFWQKGELTAIVSKKLINSDSPDWDWDEARKFGKELESSRHDIKDMGIYNVGWTGEEYKVIDYGCYKPY